jgi:protein-arginine kinase activator protein McsA
MGSKKKVEKEKPLEKMTSTELREVAKEIPEIVGVHGMNKVELIQAVKKARGIKEAPGKKTNTSIREIKKKIKELKSAREKAIKSDDQDNATLYRRRISRLKKKTRKVA